MVAILGFTRERVVAAVKEMYTDVATAPERPYHFPVGRAACRTVGYSEALLEGIAEEALASFAGVGCPFRAGVIRSGATVLDIGSGAGTDALIAARLVGPKGKVYALDMTPAMVKKLRALAAAVAGGAILAYAHLVEFSYILELAGFAVLGSGVFLDLRARRELSADVLVGQGNVSAP